MHVDQQVALFAQQHHGLVTFSVARGFGLTESDCRYRIETGRWMRVRRGVFLIGGAPVTHEVSRLAVTLSTPGPSVCSHDTAAIVHNLTRYVDSKYVHILVPRSSQITLSGVKCHRSSVFLLDDFTIVEGVGVTNAARTICDIGGRFSNRILGAMIDDALRRNLCTLETIRQTKARLGRAPGRKLTPLEKVLVDRIPGYDPGDSNLESQAIAVLRRAKLPMPRLGYGVTLNGIEFHLDLAWPEYRVCVELDGWAFHNGRRSFDEDRERTNLLIAAGWRAFRFTSKTTADQMLQILQPLLV